MHGSLKEDIYVRRGVSAGHRLGPSFNSGSSGTAKHTYAHVDTRARTRIRAQAPSMERYFEV